jgi:phenylacetate-CoA ligase
MDELTVRVEATVSPDDHRRDELREQLARRVKDSVGVTVDVEVLDPDGLERSLGKAKRIEDKRGAGG